MIETPWGSAEDLRAGRARERLLGATVIAVAERRYEHVTVADLLELTGLSRATFYRYFDDRQACFLATYEALMNGVRDAVGVELAREGSWDARLEAAFARLLALIATYPEAAHLCLVDVHAAGPAAVDRGARSVGRFAALLAEAFEHSPGRAGLPRPVVRAILGGVYKVVASRVRRGQAAELPALRPEIQAWALSYRTPPGPIRRQRSRQPPTSGPDFAPYGTAGRIYEATALEVAEQGYAGATIDGIAARAGASAHTFYRHFANKHDALVATYDAGVAQAYAFTLPALRHAVDWPHGFRAALQTMFSFLAGNPAWTRTAVVEALGAGPALIARADEQIDRFAALLAPGRELAPGMGEIGAEATAGAIYGLHYAQIRTVGPERLLEVVPACAYAGLAPFVGAELALAVANDGARTGRRPPPGA